MYVILLRDILYLKYRCWQIIGELKDYNQKDYLIKKTLLLRFMMKYKKLLYELKVISNDDESFNIYNILKLEYNKLLDIILFMEEK